MFDDLSKKLESFVKHVTGQGRMTPENIRDSLREVRRALLEADVSYQVVKDLDRVNFDPEFFQNHRREILDTFQKTALAPVG